MIEMAKRVEYARLEKREATCLLSVARQLPPVGMGLVTHHAGADRSGVRATVNRS